MKRLIGYHLREWKTRKHRKPLLLRGARQVGKTYAVRDLGTLFDNFIELNLETNSEARDIFAQDLKIERILFQLAELTKQELIPGKTLLFIDEIQKVPEALIALRYFYEKIPDLHVIAAGSLLDFAIEQVGMPVGRIHQMYMYPLSFLEFLCALEHDKWVSSIISPTPLFSGLHDIIIQLVGEYLAVGGMPEAVLLWGREKKTVLTHRVHSDIVGTYRKDFATYTKKHQIKYTELVFEKSMEQLSRKFMFSKLGEYRKRELLPAVGLLEKAGIMYPIYRNAGQGIPIGAGADLSDFKMIFLDVGLTQALLGYDLRGWILKPLDTFINKGVLVEAFVGQELLAYGSPLDKGRLYYWARQEKKSNAEIDYLIQLREHIIPVEVKSGSSTQLRSMFEFLQTHKNSPYGLRFWSSKEEHGDQISSYSLYSIAKPLLVHNEELGNALSYLVS